MKNWAVVLLFLTNFSLLKSTGKADSVCGEWTTYKEEKCIKVITSAGTQYFEEAVRTCASHDNSKLISIASADKQAFLAELFFTKEHLVENVWLGARISSQQVFHWENNASKTTFRNWAPGNPKNHSTESCVQMHAEEELRGKWSNEPCSKKNQVACERGQTWSLQKMQEMIAKMIENPVPLGFIYVQLPKEKNPADIWPGLTFTDISAAYDSAFFRIAGSKGAAAFGAEQEQQAPAIDQIKYTDCALSPTNLCETSSFSSTWEDTLNLSSGGWSRKIVSANGFNTGGSPSRFLATLSFHTTPGAEVRPRNFAIKVWKRTG